MILRVTNERLQVHKRRRDAELEVEGDRAPVVREEEGDPALLGQQDVEMPVEVSGESAFVKRGVDAVADNEDRARLRNRVEGKRGQKHDIQVVLEPDAKTKARLEPRRGQKRESTQPLPDLQEDVENTTLKVLVLCGFVPIQGGSSSSTEVPVGSSTAVSSSVEDTVQTNVLVPSDVGMQLSNSGTVGSLYVLQ